MDADKVVIGVIVGLMVVLLCAYWDYWHNPKDYSELEERE